jgi:ESS family glutamate:Na+ symporter
LADSVDSLAWHIAIIGIAVLIGYGILEGLQKLEIACFPDYKTRLFAGFPLFPLCMLGGVILQIVTKFIKVDLLVDRAQMDRISGAALDYLALAAVATINVTVVAQNWLPLLIMCVAGLVWTVFSVLFFSPRLFKEAWFERGIAEFGQACGVTATGLMLLRTVDPENRTPAAMSFGYKQLLHEPIMGGGIWTAMAFTLVYRIGWLNVWIISTVMLAIWCTVAFFLARNRRIAAGR